MTSLHANSVLRSWDCVQIVNGCCLPGSIEWGPHRTVQGPMCNCGGKVEVTWSLNLLSFCFWKKTLSLLTISAWEIKFDLFSWHWGVKHWTWTLPCKGPALFLLLFSCQKGLSLLKLESYNGNTALNQVYILLHKVGTGLKNSFAVELWKDWLCY